MTSPVNVDVKLGVNKFNVDEDSPHIILKTDPDKQALEVLIKACPAGLYKSRTTAASVLITPDAWSAERAAFSDLIQRWKMGIPARDIWRGVSLRLISTRLCTRRSDKTW